MCWQLVFVIILTLVTRVCCRTTQGLIVQTEKGKMKGRIWVSQKGREFLGFTGIPYAKPPVAELRFHAPVPVDSWYRIFKATKTHAPCPQADYFANKLTILGNEDCLYLNVYKPKLGENYPVMFYIHGGSFSIGSGSDRWTSPEILLDNDVVLVVINYRLGSLGFISAEDPILPGNNGLKDQALALRWVKENIVNFGGNPNKITVFGNSAGGVAAHYFMLSPLTKGLIHKAVLQSGEATAVWTHSDSKGVAKSHAKQLGQLCDCRQSTTEDLVNCLRAVDLARIISEEQNIANSYSATSRAPFLPVVEGKYPGAFLIEDPIQTMKSKTFANVPIVIGIVEQEGAYRAAEINTNAELLNKTNTDFTSIVDSSFHIPKKELTKTGDAIREFYFGNRTIDKNSNSQLTNMFSDGWYLSTLDVTLHLLLENKFPKQQIYVYLFGYRGSTSYTHLYPNSTYDYGVCHTDELFYLLPRHELFPKYEPTKDDNEMCEVLSKMWTDFATTGDPTPDTRIWETLKNKNLQYLSIQNPTSLKMEEGLYSDRRKFWRESVYVQSWKRIQPIGIFDYMMKKIKKLFG